MYKRKYSELNEVEKTTLKREYKKTKLKKLNISLVIHIIVFIVCVTIILMAYNSWYSEYKVDDIVSDYVKDYATIAIILLFLFFMIQIIINIFKRIKINNEKTLEFQHFLENHNIELDIFDNQNKSI